MKFQIFILSSFIFCSSAFAKLTHSARPALIASHEGVSKSLVESAKQSTYSFRSIVNFPDMTPVEIHKEFMKKLWHDPILKSDHLSAYLALWRSGASETSEKNAIADIQMVITAKDELGAEELLQYVKKHEDDQILGKSVQFKKVDEFLIIPELQLYSDSTEIFTTKKYLLFEKQADVATWMGKIDDAIKERNKTALLSLLGEKFDQLTVQKVNEAFDKSNYINLSAEMTYLKGYDRTGAEPSAWGYMAGDYLVNK